MGFTFQPLLFSGFTSSSAGGGGGGGTVTSVGLADSTGLFNITGSPVTMAGTLTLASLQSKTANTFFAAPNGSSGSPTFRAIVASDIPILNQNTTGTASNITATSNSTLTTLSSLSLPESQVTGLGTTYATVSLNNLTTTAINVQTLQFSPTAFGSYFISTQATGSGSSNLTLSTGNVTTSTAGQVAIVSGNATGTADGGAALVQGGTSVDGTAGSVFLLGGSSSGIGIGGNTSLIAGSAVNGSTAGTITIQGGQGTGIASGGNTQVSGGNSNSGSAGGLILNGGNSNSGSAGGVVISAGISSTGSQGLVAIYTDGNLSLNPLNGPAAPQLQFYEGTDSFYVGFQASNSLTANGPVWTLPLTDGTSGQFLQTNGLGQLTFATVSSGSGTVTNVSVVSANGLAGTVTNPTTTPALTLSTTVTGLLKGNGTAISAATAGTDYVIPSGSITGTASNITATSNSTLTTLSSLSLPGSQVTGNISGNATNITATSNSTLVTLSSLSLPTTQLTGTLQAAQFPALTGDITTTAGSLITTLAIVNSNVGSFGSSTSIPSFTVNAKGLITAASGNVVIAPAGTLSGTTLNSTVVTSSLTSLGAQSTALNMNSHLINNVTNPASPQDAATKNYVDNAVAGINPAVAVQAATTSASNTSSYTYNNGVGGVGATFTANTSNTPLVVDGYTFTALGQRLLVKNDTQSPSGAFNGIYYVTQVQTSLLPVILTRSLDYDQPSDMNNTGVIPVINGTVNALTQWVLTSQINTVGTDPLIFVLFAQNPNNYLDLNGANSPSATINWGNQELVNVSQIGIGTPTPATATSIDIVNNTGLTQRIIQTGYGANVGTRNRYANGTLGSPTAATNGNTLGFISGMGYGATAFPTSSTGAVNFIAEGTFTNSSMPTAVQINTTPTGSITSTVAATFNPNGQLTLPTFYTTSGTLLNDSSGNITSANGTAGYVLTSNGPTSLPTYQPAPGTASAFFASSPVTTQSSVISGTSFTTFSNSPAFTFTPTITGTYKVYSSLGLNNNSNSIVATARIFNTSGGATLLEESQAGSFATSGSPVINVFAQSVYTLTAGTSYIFDIQGKNSSPGAVFLDATASGSFYMFAELEVNGSSGAGITEAQVWARVAYGM